MVHDEVHPSDVTRRHSPASATAATVPGAVARHYDEPTGAALIVAIANINVWNRLNAAVPQPAGTRKG